MLIAMAVYDTTDNQRTEYTRRTLESLRETVDWDQHRLIVSDNGSCQATHDVYANAGFQFEVIYNGTNLGTAKAINRAWYRRRDGEHCVKMDNDVCFHQSGWVDWMEDVFARDPEIGVCGLKRKDLAECPWSENDWYRSEVYMLPHEAGQRWLVVEEVKHVMGTCQAYSSSLLDDIGFLVQPSKYGFDDSLASIRAHVAGYKTVFLHGFEIDHIDSGLGKYTVWKRKQARAYMNEYHKLKLAYQDGKLPVYEGWQE